MFKWYWIFFNTSFIQPACDMINNKFAVVHVSRNSESEVQRRPDIDNRKHRVDTKWNMTEKCCPVWLEENVLSLPMYSMKSPLTSKIGLIDAYYIICVHQISSKYLQETVSLNYFSKQGRGRFIFSKNNRFCYDHAKTWRLFFTLDCGSEEPPPSSSDVFFLYWWWKTAALVEGFSHHLSLCFSADWAWGHGGLRPRLHRTLQPRPL